MRQVNLLYRQLIIIIILWEVISCSGTSHNSTTTPSTLTTSSTTIIKTTKVTKKVPRVNDILMNNLTADGSIEGDNKTTNNTLDTRFTSTNDFVSNATNADQKTNQELKAITNQTSDINNNSTSHNNNTNYTNDFNQDKLNITSRRKWTEPEKIVSRSKRARGRGKNQGYDSTDRAKAHQGKSSAFSINFKISEKQLTLYLTSTLSMLTVLLTQSLPVPL